MTFKFLPRRFWLVYQVIQKKTCKQNLYNHCLLLHQKRVRQWIKHVRPWITQDTPSNNFSFHVSHRTPKKNDREKKTLPICLAMLSLSTNPPCRSNTLLPGFSSVEPATSVHVLPSKSRRCLQLCACLISDRQLQHNRWATYGNRLLHTTGNQRTSDINLMSNGFERPLKISLCPTV